MSLQVGVLQCCLPNLLELHVGGNNISSLHINVGQGLQQEQLQLAEQQQYSAAGLVGFLSLQVRA